MGRKRIEVVTCDWHSCTAGPETIRRYQIAYPDGRVAWDLCAEHSRGLDAYRSLKPNHSKVRSTDDLFIPVTEEQIVRARRQ
jgi:hypothetical protein